LNILENVSSLTLQQARFIFVESLSKHYDIRYLVVEGELD